MTKKYRIIYKDTSLEAPEGAFLIGRSTDCHLVVDDTSVSRIHAAIIYEKGMLWVEDRDSRNGVLVNGDRIAHKKRLTHGDAISIGHQVVRIASATQARDPDRTVGLRHCNACSTWVSAEDLYCSKCGASFNAKAHKEESTDKHIAPANETSKREDSIVIDQHPLTAMAGLSKKALHVGKTDEAEQLISGALKSAFSSLRHGQKIASRDFDAISDALIALAKAAKSSDHISALFTFHTAAKRLMSRDLIENLYEAVRVARYRTCPQMNRYLTYLDTQASTFSPGEQFLYRRLTGLVKLCS